MHVPVIVRADDQWSLATNLRSFCGYGATLLRTATVWRDVYHQRVETDTRDHARDWVHVRFRTSTRFPHAGRTHGTITRYEEDP